MENENIEKQEFFKTYLGIKNKNVLSSLEQMAYVWKVKDKEVIICCHAFLFWYRAL